MKKKISMGLGILALIVMLGTGVSSAMAANTTSDATFVSRCGQTIQKGYGMMSDTITKLLGMSQEQIQAEHESGKSLTEVAQEKNVSEQAIIGSMLEARTQNLQEAVSNGDLTQEQADERIAWTKEKIESRMKNGEGCFGQGGCNSGYHR